MSDIRFKCSNCRGRLVVDMAAAGHHADCPHCKHRLMIPQQSEPPPPPVKPQVDTRPPAAQTSSGIQPLSGAVAGILGSTQKISDAKPSAPDPVKALAAAPVVTQKIAAIPVTSSPPPVLVPPQPTVPTVTQKITPSVNAPATPDGRERLSDLIAGLQRDNAELRKKLTATSAVPAGSSPELEALRKDLAARDAKIKELEAGFDQAKKGLEAASKSRADAQSFAAKVQADLAAAQQIVQEQTIRAEAAAQREREAGSQIAALVEQAKRIETRASESKSKVAFLQNELRVERDGVSAVAKESDGQRVRANRHEAAAMTARLDLGAMQQELLRLQKELSAASLARDIAIADVALARQKIRIEDADGARIVARLSAANNEAEAAMATLRSRNESLDAERAREKHALAEAETEIERLRTDWNREVAERRNLEGRAARDHEEIDRLTSEKSALRIAFAEVEDRAKDFDTERARVNELQQHVTETREENAFLREQLEAGNRAAGELDACKKRIAQLTAENESLAIQVKHPKQEAKSLQAASASSVNEARLRHRVAELEETLRTADR